MPLPVSREEKRRYGICDTFLKEPQHCLPAAADHVNAGSGSGGPGGDPACVYLEKSFILRYGARTGRPLEKIMTTATSRYFALLALTAALWGAQPLLVKITMRELNPSTMTAVRYLLMSITFFALMRCRSCRRCA